VGPSLERKNTHMREHIHVETKITMAFTLLGNGFFYKCVERFMALQKVQHQLLCENFVQQLESI
jgi:hypothetical protein